MAENTTRDKWLAQVGPVLDKIEPRDAAVIAWDASEAIQAETVRRFAARIALARSMITDDLSHTDKEVLAALDGSHAALSERVSIDVAKRIYPHAADQLEALRDEQIKDTSRADELEVVGNAQDERRGETAQGVLGEPE